MTTEQLWSDERITAEAESIAAFWQQHETPRSLWRRDIVTLLKHMREQMTVAHLAELARLRAELQQSSKNVASWKTGYMAKDAEAIEEREKWIVATEELARLRGELAAAGRWEPVEDGEVSSFTYVDNGGKLLGVFAGDDYSDWYATDDLPDGVRLCRLVPPADAGGEVQP